MKKFLSLVITALMALGAQAQYSPVGVEAASAQRAQIEKALDMQVAQNDLVMPQLRKAAPEGTKQDYSLKGYYYYSGAVYSFDDLSTELVTSADGQNVYIRSLFPQTINDIWHHATVQENGNLIISAEESTYQFDYYGNGSVLYNMKLGELILTSTGSISAVKDVELIKDGTRYYVDDDAENPTRYYGLYSTDDKFRLWTYGLCFDLNLLEGVGERVVVPETATSSDFIYYTTDRYGSKLAQKGFVAVDGNDYYFNLLTPNGGILKGTRSGSRITVERGQYLGNDTGTHRYFMGYVTDWELDEEGYTIGENCDLVFNISEDGKVIALLEPDNTFAMEIQMDNSIADYCSIRSIEAYAGDVPAIPSDPYNLAIGDYHDSYGQYYVSFNIDNLDKDGKYINPEKMAYYFYMDEEPLEFTIDVYEYIDENMTLVPYGFVDNHGGYDIYWSGNEGSVYIYEDLFDMLGIQSVYTVDGKEYKSNVVSIDLDGNTYVNFREYNGIRTATANTPQSVWYDLSGRRVNGDHQGLVISMGKKFMK